MRARTITIAIGVAAAGVMALGAQPAAAVVKYDTKVTIAMDRGFLYHGFVKSQVNKCEVERRVVLFKKRPGADRQLGRKDRTVGSSRWPWGTWGVNLHRAQAGWRVYAKARHKVRDQFVCFASRSPTYTFG